MTRKRTAFVKQSDELLANKRPKILADSRKSDAPPSKKLNWVDRRRTLVLATRGVPYRARRVLQDLTLLMPHSRPDTKLDVKKQGFHHLLNEILEMRNSSHALFLESRKRQDLYLWLAKSSNSRVIKDDEKVKRNNEAESDDDDDDKDDDDDSDEEDDDDENGDGAIDDGPTVKFLLENLHTMNELKFPGNCLRGSRPLLHFSNDVTAAESAASSAKKLTNWDVQPELRLIRELLVQIFGVPAHHPKSQPFIDRVYEFSLADGLIWFRHYAIDQRRPPREGIAHAGEGAAIKAKVCEAVCQLSEVGPRFSLRPIRVFQRSFCGRVIYENPEYVAPNFIRSEQRRRAKAAANLANRAKSKTLAKRKRPKSNIHHVDPTDDIFQ